ncbi:MAG: hypothetical protein PUC44_04295 [Eubacteriales bacterium]|nr:hypothetical protein [Eubacteriales bacterium]
MKGMENLEKEEREIREEKAEGVFLRTFRKAAEIIEYILVVLTVIAVIIAIIGIIPRIFHFWEERESTASFEHILSAILAIVVGTEFIRMMLKPTFKNVAEVLTFLIARHVIVHETSPMDNLLSVIAIAILFLMQSALWRMQTKGEYISMVRDRLKRRQMRQMKKADVSAISEEHTGESDETEESE